MPQPTAHLEQGAGNSGANMLDDLMAGVDELQGSNTNTTATEKEEPIDAPGDGERGGSQPPAPL